MMLTVISLVTSVVSEARTVRLVTLLALVMLEASKASVTSDASISVPIHPARALQMPASFDLVADIEHADMCV